MNIAITFFEEEIKKQQERLNKEADKNSCYAEYLKREIEKNNKYINNIENKNNIEEIINDIEERQFGLDMKDTWNSEDYKRFDLLFDTRKELEKLLK